MAISGGKDSTVLAHVMTTLKKRHNYPISLHLLAIDEGIKGYRDDSLQTVHNNSQFYGLPLKILSYSDLFGRTMDQVVGMTGVRTSCSFCGVYRRKALNIGFEQLGGDRLYTGHNADDIAETVLMNMLKGDAARLVSCTDSISGIRCKPLKFCYEKEIVLYAHYLKLEYFSTECKYSKEAFRSPLKEFVKHLRKLRPEIIREIILEASLLRLKKGVKTRQRQKCNSCGGTTSGKCCKICQFNKLFTKLENNMGSDLQIAPR